MRRKLVAVMLAVMVLSTSLAGCGGSNTDQKEDVYKRQVPTNDLDRYFEYRKWRKRWMS